MTIDAYIPRDKIEDAFCALQQLPDSICPHAFSEDECGKRKKLPETEVELRAFFSNYTLGFFVFGKRASFDINIAPKYGYSSISTELKQGLGEPEAVAVLKVMAQMGSVFSFAAEFEEYEYRNMHTKKYGINKVMTWVGRDLRKYVPGIYWITVLSNKYKDAAISLVNTLGAKLTQLDADHLMVKAFGSPEEWREYAPGIDAWLVKQPEFFSIERVRAELDAVKTFADLFNRRNPYP